MNQPITKSIPTTPHYGYIHWRSKLTGKEGKGAATVKEPALEVALLNGRLPEIHHWFTPA